MAAYGALVQREELHEVKKSRSIFSIIITSIRVVSIQKKSFWLGIRRLERSGRGAELPHNLPSVAAVVQTVLPLE